jgi:SHS2 domain-containing protein
MTTPDRGYRELDHTADWTLEVWAPDMAELLEEAALGMYRMSGVETGRPCELSRHVELEWADRESLLVGFLSELLYLLQADRVGFEDFQLDVSDGHLDAKLRGGPVASVDKEIKAVTWHDVRVEERDSGLEARVTFDV